MVLYGAGSLLHGNDLEGAKFLLRKSSTIMNPAWVGTLVRTTPLMHVVSFSRMHMLTYEAQCKTCP